MSEWLRWVLWCLGAPAMVVAVFASAVPGARDLLILLPHVVVAVGVLVAIVSLVVGIGCWIGAGAAWHIAGPHTSRRGRTARRWRAVGVTLLTGMLGCAGTLSGVGYAVFADDYDVLAPVSPGGCRVVVSNGSGMFSASGEVYLAEPGTIHLVDTGASWFQDDEPGADPIGEGTWSLTWQGRTARLAIWSQRLGTGGNRLAFTPARQPIACPR